MVVNAAEFFRQGVLGDAVVVIQPSLGAPADVQHRVDVLLAPLHNLAHLVPVVHLLKGELLHRRAGDDKAVELLVLHVGEGLIKGVEMVGAGVLAHMGGGVEQLHVHLQRGVAQQAQQLRLGFNLRGHQVEDSNL